MLKSISNLGTVLNKTEQRKITGGNWYPRTEEDCHLCNGYWGGRMCALGTDSPCYQ